MASFDDIVVGIEDLDVFLESKIDYFENQDKYAELDQGVAELRSKFYTVGQPYDYPIILTQMADIVNAVKKHAVGSPVANTKAYGGDTADAKIVDDTVVITAGRDVLDSIRVTFLMNHGLTPLVDTETAVTFNLKELPRLKHYEYVPQNLSPPRKRVREETIYFGEEGPKRTKVDEISVDDLLPDFTDDSYDVLSDDVLDFLGLHEVKVITPDYFGQPAAPPPDERERSYYWANENIPCEGTPARDIFAPFGTDTYDYHKYRATTSLAFNVETNWNENYFWSTNARLYGAEGPLDSALFFDLTKRRSKWMKTVYNLTEPLTTERMRIRNDLIMVNFTSNALVFISVSIDISATIRHAGVIVIDNVHKKVARFEPHGGYTRMYEMVTVDFLTKTWVNSTFPGYAYVPPADFMFRDGVQVREIYAEEFSQKRDSAGRLQEAGGYCYAWVMMFIWVYERKYRTCNAREIYGFFDELTSDELALHVRQFMHYLAQSESKP